MGRASKAEREDWAKFLSLFFEGEELVEKVDWAKKERKIEGKAATLRQMFDICEALDIPVFKTLLESLETRGKLLETIEVLEREGKRIVRASSAQKGDLVAEDDFPF